MGHEVPQCTKLVGYVYHLPRNTYLYKKNCRQMMTDNIFEQLKNDKIQWDVTKTNNENCLVLELEKVFLGYPGTPESNQPWGHLETNKVLGISYCVWLAMISGVVQYEDAPRTGTMEIHSGKDYYCECLCSRGEQKRDCDCKF